MINVEQIPGDSDEESRICFELVLQFFPADPKQFVRGVILKYKIFPMVKQELNVRIQKFPDHSVHLEVPENE